MQIDVSEIVDKWMKETHSHTAVKTYRRLANDAVKLARRKMVTTDELYVSRGQLEGSAYILHSLIAEWLTFKGFSAGKGNQSLLLGAMIKYIGNERNRNLD